MDRKTLSDLSTSSASRDPASLRGLESMVSEYVAKMDPQSVRALASMILESNEFNRMMKRAVVAGAAQQSGLLAQEIMAIIADGGEADPVLRQALQDIDELSPGA